MKFLLFSFPSILLCFSCKETPEPWPLKIDNPAKVLSVEHDPKSTEHDSGLKLDSLKKALNVNLNLDSLLTSLTKQENVKIVTKLNTEWETEKGIYNYSGGGYKFSLKLDECKAGTNAILFDGKNRINFNNYGITIVNEDGFNGEDFSFNYYNSLRNPVIVEVCEKRFLYSVVEHMCNGLGCSANISMIYDLTSHKPFFIENFGISFDGFYLSDFNDDRIPDILLISRKENSATLDFTKQEFLFTVFSLSAGNFKRNRSFRMELFGINNHSELYPPGEFSITVNQGFK